MSTTQNWLPRCALLALSLIVTTSAVNAAFAEDKPWAALPGEVLVILAGAEAGGTIDPSLERIKALKEPPFKAFTSMKILSRTPIALKDDESATVELPNGRRLQLNCVERMPDGRAKVQVSINKPNQKDYLPLLQVIASPGEPFFVAGQKFQGGTLVIGVSVGEHAAAPKTDKK